MLYLTRSSLFRHVHNEPSAHRYAVSWTTARESRHAGNAGGAFFVSKYGIKVCAARDTVVVWEPREWHGTGLAHCDPGADDPGFYQAGLAIVTPASLTNLWKRVRDKELSVEEAEKELIASEE
jgi:hypothetical protein